MLAEEKARVLSVQGGRATLELEPQACCGSCGLCRAFAGGMRLDAEAAEGLRAGQTVVVALSRGGSLLSASLLFGLPLIGLVAGVLLGRVWLLPGLTSDGSSGLLAVAGMGAAFLVAIVYDRKFAGKTVPRPVILRIEDSGSAEAEGAKAEAAGAEGAKAEAAGAEGAKAEAAGEEGAKAEGAKAEGAGAEGAKAEGAGAEADDE